MSRRILGKREPFKKTEVYFMKKLALLLAFFLPTITFAEEDTFLEGENQQISHYQQKGIASWYGPGFAGHRTASGERFNPAHHTLAHRTLKLGTLVRVTNLRNNQSVIARVTDRGPFRRGRIADLSASAASAIGLKSSGTAPVLIVALG
jgi:rare lipoprotein A (peptidoglycan hydrolase)